jgi:cellulose 1,4-beta-cellobiosidase
LRFLSIVTRFDEKRVTQFFIQDGKKIEVPSPKLPGFPPENGITNDYCKAKVVNFDDKDRFTSVGGFEKHIDALRRPMVMAMSITDDVSGAVNRFCWLLY